MNNANLVLLVVFLIKALVGRIYTFLYENLSEIFSLTIKCALFLFANHQEHLWNWEWTWNFVWSS